MSLINKIKVFYKAVIPYKWRVNIRFRLDSYKHKWHHQYSKIFIRYKFNHKVHEESVLNSIMTLSDKPLISIVIPGCSNVLLVENTFRSIEAQLYDHYELLLSCPPGNQYSVKKWVGNFLLNSVRYVEQEEYDLEFILKEAKGKYVGILYAGDELTSDCLYEMVKAIFVDESDLIYSDNDLFVKNGKYLLPNYKPNYSPVNLLSQNYIGNFSLFKNDFLKEIFTTEKLRNNQHYDLLLKATERTKKIFHITSVLYHQRMIPESEEVKIQSQETLIDAVMRRGINAEVLLTSQLSVFRVKRRITHLPLISIITPFKDKAAILGKCLNSILRLSTYYNFEFIGISNNSEEAETFTLMRDFSSRDTRIRFYEHNIPFNYSSLNNYGASIAKGEHLILLNNDIEIITPDWIESLLEYSQLQETGAVGAKLYFPNNKVQHAGLIIGLGGIAGNSHKLYKREDAGFNNRLQMAQNVSAVTAACLMIKKSLYDEVGGLDEENLPVAFNDVDFCLKLVERGYQNVFTPYCEAFHYESASRGLEITAEKRKRFEKESDYMKSRHNKIITRGDPYYNPNLTNVYEDFSLINS